MSLIAPAGPRSLLLRPITTIGWQYQTADANTLFHYKWSDPDLYPATMIIADSSGRANDLYNLATGSSGLAQQPAPPDMAYSFENLDGVNAAYRAESPVANPWSVGPAEDMVWSFVIKLPSGYALQNWTFFFYADSSGVTDYKLATFGFAAPDVCFLFLEDMVSGVDQHLMIAEYRNVVRALRVDEWHQIVILFKRADTDFPEIKIDGKTYHGRWWEAAAGHPFGGDPADSKLFSDFGEVGYGFGGTAGYIYHPSPWYGNPGIAPFYIAESWGSKGTEYHQNPFRGAPPY